MKKIMLSTIAAGAVFAAAPAMAQVDLKIGGYTKNYVGWLSQDERQNSAVEADAPDARSFDMLRDSEWHLNAEATADNGLTYGFHTELNTNAGNGANVPDESYLYMSSNLGRVNLGSEDGANYLLQVAAPSADSNIDGIRQYIQPVNYAVAAQATTRSGLDANANGIDDADDAAITAAQALTANGIDYENAATSVDEKITYLSPIWSGFQFGVSYTPEISIFEGTNTAAVNSSSGILGFDSDNVDDEFGSAYEGAARYEGTFNNVGFAVGAGYTKINLEGDSGAGVDDYKEWNVGLDADVGAFGVGAIYTRNNGAADSNGDGRTYVLGADYTTGPFQIGASYLNNNTELGAAAAEVDTKRFTGGVVYTAAPGLSFRGSVSRIEHDFSTAVGMNDIDATSVMGGVQMNF